MAVSECLTQPPEIVAGYPFEPFGQAAVEGSPRLLRNLPIGSVTDDVVGEPNANDVHRGDAAADELVRGVLHPPDGPVVKEGGIRQRERASGDGEKSDKRRRIGARPTQPCRHQLSSVGRASAWTRQCL